MGPPFVQQGGGVGLTTQQSLHREMERLMLSDQDTWCQVQASLAKVASRRSLDTSRVREPSPSEQLVAMLPCIQQYMVYHQ
jgi:hypothetical protein